MKILFLAHRIPYPPNKGEKIRAYHELEYLGARHTVDLFCFADSPEEARGHQALAPFCRRIYVHTLSRWKAMWRAARASWKGEPFSLGYFHSAEFQSAVRKAVAEDRYDSIFVYCSAMGQYVPQPCPCPAVIDFVDVDSAKWAQYASASNFPFSWVYAREAHCLAEYEKKLVRAFSASVVATAQEAAQLAGEHPLHVTVVRNGVRLRQDAEVPRIPEELRALQPYVVFVGTMDYRPNVDAVTYFVEQILPAIHGKHPELRFLIVGHRPARQVRRLGRRPGVIVTGVVPDIFSYLQGAVAAVAPFRISQGVQNKILEALATGLPVVSTSRPAKAVDARHAETLLIADTPKDFAEAVIALLEDPLLRSRLQAGAALVREQFDWDTNLRRLEQLLESVVGGSGTASARGTRREALPAEVNHSGERGEEKFAPESPILPTAGSARPR